MGWSEQGASEQILVEKVVIRRGRTLGISMDVIITGCLVYDMMLGGEGQRRVLISCLRTDLG